MNREILFKGKRLDNGQWVEGNYGFFKSVNGNEKMHHITTEDGKAIRIDPSTLCQFTGITDKNGKKIFEKDVVAASYGYRGEVEFDSFIYHKLECTIADDIEVIGNVFDNPELLNI